VFQRGTWGDLLPFYASLAPKRQPLQLGTGLPLAHICGHTISRAEYAECKNLNNGKWNRWPRRWLSGRNSCHGGRSPKPRKIQDIITAIIIPTTRATLLAWMPMPRVPRHQALDPVFGDGLLFTAMKRQQDCAGQSFIKNALTADPRSLRSGTKLRVTWRRACRDHKRPRPLHPRTGARLSTAAPARSADQCRIVWPLSLQRSSLKASYAYPFIQTSVRRGSSEAQKLLHAENKHAVEMTAGFFFSSDHTPSFRDAPLGAGRIHAPDHG